MRVITIKLNLPKPVIFLGATIPCERWNDDQYYLPDSQLNIPINLLLSPEVKVNWLSSQNAELLIADAYLLQKEEGSKLIGPPSYICHQSAENGVLLWLPNLQDARGGLEMIPESIPTDTAKVMSSNLDWALLKLTPGQSFNLTKYSNWDSDDEQSRINTTTIEYHNNLRFSIDEEEYDLCLTAPRAING